MELRRDSRDSSNRRADLDYLVKSVKYDRPQKLVTFVVGWDSESSSRLLHG